jgi:hypothetical protein
MNNIFPKTGSELEWAAAGRRLEDYLRALQVFDRGQQNQIILRVLERAAGKQAANPTLCPTVLAMEEIRAAMDQWFEQIFSSRDRASVRGFIALLAIDAPNKWPAAFLAENVPSDFRCAMLQSEIRAAPDLRVSNMVPQPFANPLRDGINWPDAGGRLARRLPPLVMKGTTAVLSLFANSSGAWPQ